MFVLSPTVCVSTGRLLNAGVPWLNAGVPWLNAGVPWLNAGVPWIDAGVPWLNAGVPWLNEQVEADCSGDAKADVGMFVDML
eukprot:881221-Pyramimonas_sp.AAC.1